MSYFHVYVVHILFYRLRLREAAVEIQSRLCWGSWVGPPPFICSKNIFIKFIPKQNKNKFCFIHISKSKAYEPSVVDMQNIELHSSGLNSHFYVLLRHNKLKWRYCIYNGLGIRRITLLNKMCDYHTPVFHMTKPILLSNQSKQSCKK